MKFIEDELIKHFEVWYKTYCVNSAKDIYRKEFTLENLNGMGKKSFIDLFTQFSRSGGMVQSGGQRFAAKFEEYMENNYNEFKKFILEPFGKTFDLKSWIKRVTKDHKYFGIGTATIYLNKLDPYAYPIKNDKSINGLIKLGYDINPNMQDVHLYPEVLDITRSILAEYPDFKDNSKLDKFLEFIMIDAGEKLAAKFLRENDEGFWIFQCNPSIYDLKLNLQQNKVTDWQIGGHKSRIKAGDKGIIWVTGNESGCYVFIDIISAPYQVEGVTRAKIKIDLDISEKPILERIIKKEPWFNNFKGGNQGTTFDMTKREYQKLRELAGYTTKRSTVKEENMSKTSKMLNKIYFGPPGTGKTYKVIEEVLRTVLTDKESKELNWENRSLVVNKFKELRRMGYIEMVTFHQSYSYEEFIEGIRPDTNSGTLTYETKSGVFKTFVDKNKTDITQIDNPFNGEIDKLNFFKVSLGDTTKPEEDEIYQYCIEKGRIAIGYGEGLDFNLSNDRESIKKQLEGKIKNIDNDNYNITSVHYLKNVLKVGDIIIVSEGLHSFRAIGMVKSDKYFFEKEMPFAQQREVTWLKVFESSLPVKLVSKGQFSQATIYRIEKKRLNFSAISEILSGNTSVLKRNIAFVIDEVNRGNISKIFGELITLLEADKRDGEENGVPVQLPYSNDDFILPKNLYLFGTMNTTDRSIAMMDMALRRRFNFIEVRPDFNQPKVPKTVGTIQLKEIMESINLKISILLGSDFQIGHSYFMNGKADDCNSLKQTWFTEIIPLLKEYFHDEPKKLKALIGPFMFIHENKLEIPGFEYLSEEGNSETIDPKIPDNDFSALMNLLIK